LIEIKNVYAGYEDIEILHNVSLYVNEGEIVSVLGPNGAGKTTLIKTIMRLTKIQKGHIYFRGERVDRLEPHLLVNKKIAYVPEGGQLFPDMSLIDNLLMGAYYNRKNKNEVNESLKRVYNLYPFLRDNYQRLAKTFSGGERGMIGIARALMANPSLIIFDEPSLGLAPKVIKQLFKVIQNLRQENITILIVEQNVKIALNVADRAYVLENGSIKMSGLADDILHNDYIKKSYLGI